MPGLVGIITKRPKMWAEETVCNMMKTMLHEPFYTSGVWSDDSVGVYAAWVARRGSFAEEMPIRNESGDTTLLFSGEEFPDPGVYKTLQDRGHKVSSDGPSYLVHRYEEEKDFPKQLNGRFHGLVADRSQGQALLFNDRYGLHRLYCYEGEDAFYFAAEAKAILKVCPKLRRIDQQGLGEFIVCGCVLDNRTLFPGISVLPPGSAYSFRNGALERKEPYFEPSEWENQEPLPAGEYFDALRGAFTTNLSRYFGGSERIGVSLTGGLDTRIIMAWHDAEPGSLPCYTFGSMYRDNEDVKLARKVAQICHQRHEVITTGEEFLKNFPRYAERTVYMTDACVDMGRSPDLYVNEKAREIAPVRMVGTYGSEILLQDVMFKAVQPRPGLYHSDLSTWLVKAGQSYQRCLEGNQSTFVAFRQSPWHHFGVLSLEQTQVAVRTPYLDNDLVRTVYRAPKVENINQDSRLRLLLAGNPALAALRTDRGTQGLNWYITRAALEFSFKAEYAYDYGMPQWLAKLDHAFRFVHFERIWVGRHKIFHFRPWYRDYLGAYVREMLLDSRSLARPYLDPGMVKRIVDAHLKGNGNYTIELNRLLTLELTHRLFVD
ncbi:asparagine synthase-related protein [Occallatibacter savannae]|uniref:asparagine synthase-related protein n=1 Tax=Occallatibacter savannae TaxID=1002691 RepID=UPI000D693D3F|nr:asparagine synthase-related protein [Occallatibacter savannae]